MIHYTRIETPLGQLTAARSARGICYLSLPGQAGGLSAFAEKYYPGEALQEDADALREVQHQLEEYFSGRRRKFDLPLDLKAPSFYVRVLHEVAKITYGVTSTYGAIAKKMKKPGAARAVGGANAHNPIPIIIPCHRVLASDGSLGGYGGGLTMKRRLLELEGVI